MVQNNRVRIPFDQIKEMGEIIVSSETAKNTFEAVNTEFEHEGSFHLSSRKTKNKIAYKIMRQAGRSIHENVWL